MSLESFRRVSSTCRRIAASASMLVACGSLAGSQQSLPTSAADTAIAVRIDTLLPLASVVMRALAASPSATSGVQAIRTARSELRVANGAYIPSLSLNSSAVRSDIVSSPLAGGGATGSSYSAGLGSSVELFTGGRRGAERARASADVGAAEANEMSLRFQVTLVAERAFFETLRGEDLITVARARVARAERGLRYAQDRVRAGTATRSDELRARLELTTGRQQLLAARDTLQSAAYNLGRLVGSPGPVGAQRPASLDPRPLALTDSQVARLAVEAAPVVRAADAAARATAAGARAARSLYAPDLRLSGGYSAANTSPVLGATRPGWQMAVGTSFPLFNGFQREDAITRNEAAAEIARSTALDATRLARAESARLLSALNFAEENIALAREAVTAAQEDLRVQTERYRAGIATSLDRLTSELAVTQAELGLVAARYNYQLTRAALEALVGRTL